MPEIKTANLVYFSGTGGTARIAEYFEQSFKRKNVEINKIEISAKAMNITYDAEMLVLIFAVHAFNAPLPVDEWIETAPDVNGKPVAVISVSGGGEVTPNTACRVATIKKLKSKGYKVVYEKMLVMPSNWITPVNDGLAITLIRVAPIKVERIVNDIMTGKENFTKPKMIDRFFSVLGREEKKAGKDFGKKITVCDSCSGCAWCASNCPRDNIVMHEGKPIFGDKCVICLRCFYGCPRKAITPGKLKFIVIKEGYDYKAVEKRMQDVTNLESIDVLAKGMLWGGVKKYLKEEEGLPLNKEDIL